MLNTWAVLAQDRVWRLTNVLLCDSPQINNLLKIVKGRQRENVATACGGDSATGRVSGRAWARLLGRWLLPWKTFRLARHGRMQNTTTLSTQGNEGTRTTKERLVSEL